MKVGDDVIETMPASTRDEHGLPAKACGQITKVHDDGSLEIKWDIGVATNVAKTWVQNC